MTRQELYHMQEQVALAWQEGYNKGYLVGQELHDNQAKMGEHIIDKIAATRKVEELVAKLIEVEVVLDFYAELDMDAMKRDELANLSERPATATLAELRTFMEKL